MDGNDSLGIIALVPDHWNDIVTVRHQVLRRLAKHYRVVWVEPARNWREFLNPSAASFLAADCWSEPTPSLEVLSTGWSHPGLHRPRWLAQAALRSRLVAARKHLLAHGATRIGLYIWRDEFAPALDLVAHDFSCYHIDDEYSFSDREQPNSVRETQLLRRVNQVIVHSTALFEKKGRVNPATALIPNGVDFRLFSTPHPEPADIAQITHPRIGYSGVIKKQLDFALLIRLAQARPQWSFVLVGPVSNVRGKEQQLAILRQMRNVHFLGGKPAEELASYVQHFDVCLMCYEVNDYTRYIYPLKLHEYLAAGRPTVSAPIETARAFSQVVTIARDEGEWLAAIELGIGETRGAGTLEAAARQSVAGAQDWDVLVERIAKLFAPPRSAAQSVRSELLQTS